MSGADNNTNTQSELLDLFGSLNHTDKIEKQYGNFVKLYNKMKKENLLEYENRIYTNASYFNRISREYLKKIEELYDATLRPFANVNPEEEINDWVKNLTKGKIEDFVGKHLNNFLFKISMYWNPLLGAVHVQ